MFERYTEAARRAIFFGRFEALARQADAIGPEHLLLGLLREETNRPSLAWPPRALPALEARRRLEEALHAPIEQPPERQIPLTMDSKRSMMEALEASVRMKHSCIHTGHLLLDYLEGLGLSVTELESHVRDLPADGGKADRPETLGT